MCLIKELKDTKHFLTAILAVLAYRYPAGKLIVIGVTGTDGKTTTASIIYHILKGSGVKVGLVTTIEARVGSKSYGTGLHTTTPNPFTLQKFLREMVRRGCSHAVLEVTSHGLDQHRVLGCNFKVGVLTNITQEHLDYHTTFRSYVLAKAKLFRQAEVSILNKEDKNFGTIAEVAGGKVVFYDPKREKGKYSKPYKSVSQNSHLQGDYNWSNALAAIKVGEYFGVNTKDITRGLGSFRGQAGRFEILQKGKGKATVVLDFAHTPNALNNVLMRCKNMKPRRLVVVFGCAGERDYRKRPFMGRIALKYADFVVLTAEDPRREDVFDVIEQIVPGKHSKVAKIPDRRQAIRFALGKFNQPGDLVLITGKGHEQSMCFGTEEVPWSDREEILKNLV